MDHGTVLNIREIRIRLGLTQEQLAKKLGVSWITVSRWERCKTTPSPLAFEKLKRLDIKIKKAATAQ